MCMGFLPSDNCPFSFQLRKAQDEIGELQTVNDHLQKRFDKLKSKRKDDT